MITICVLVLREYMFSFLCDKWIKMQFWGGILKTCWFLQENAKPSSKVSEIFYIPTSKYKWSKFSGSSPEFHVILSSVMVGYQHLIEFLIFTSLTANDVKHLFIGVSAICTYLVEYLFISFAHFLIGVFVFLLLSFESSLYVLDMSPWSDIQLVNIFAKFVMCIFIFSTWVFSKQNILILMSPMINFSFLLIILWCSVKKTLCSTISLKILPIVSLKRNIVLSFMFYI